MYEFIFAGVCKRDDMWTARESLGGNIRLRKGGLQSLHLGKMGDPTDSGKFSCRGYSGNVEYWVLFIAPDFFMDCLRFALRFQVDR